MILPDAINFYLPYFNNCGAKSDPVSSRKSPVCAEYDQFVFIVPIYCVECKNKR